MKRVTISALLCALVFGLLATWLGPKMISYWYAPPVAAGAAAAFNCTEAVNWAMNKLILTQLIGTIVGIVVGMVVGIAMRRKPVPPPATPPQTKSILDGRSCLPMALSLPIRRSGDLGTSSLFFAAQTRHRLVCISLSGVANGKHNGT